MGIDNDFTTEGGTHVFTGAFLGYGKNKPVFSSSTGNVNTDVPYFGIYSTWIKNGWYLDAVGKVQRFYNKFDTSSNNNVSSLVDDTQYAQWGVSASAQIGKRFCARNGFFAEPQAQVTYARFNGANYIADNIFPVDIGDMEITQVKGTLLVGRAFNQCGKFFEPYFKVGEAAQSSHGNKVDVSGLQFRPNLDGARAEVGAGLAYGSNHLQFHADYEAITGADYNIPWAINVGFRYTM